MRAIESGCLTSPTASTRRAKPTYLPVDVTKRAGLLQTVALAVERFGRLDVLISNAGAMPIGPMDDLAVENALPAFRQQGSGHFINIASTAARKTTPNQAVYSATKAAVLALSDGLRQELAGVLRVTVISPGFMDTSFADHIRDVALRQQLEERARNTQ